MLKLENSKDGFKLFFKKKLFIEHSKRSSAFKIGIGNSKFKMRQGSFKIKETLTKEIELNEFKINSEEKNKISISLQKDIFQLKILFKVNLKENRLEIFPNVNNSEINRFHIRLKAKPKENIFGCGGRFSEFNLNGKKIPIWVEDATPLLRVGKLLYFPQSLFISILQKEKYFCYVDTTSYSEFDFTNENKHNIYVWGIPKKIIIAKFENTLNIVKAISNYFGRQPKLPDWVFDGIILGIQGGNDIVEKKIKKALDYKIPVAAVWCQDWQGIKETSMGQQLFWNWQYDKKRYPNLPEFINKLHEMKIKFLGYICALFNIKGNQYKEASNKEYLLKNEKENPIIIRSSDFKVGIIDFSNPDAFVWFKNIMKAEMLDIGLDGWMVDYGEYCVTNADLSHEMEGVNFHNYYPVLYAKAVYETLKESGRIHDTFVFHRTGYNESIPYMMCYWAGDQLVNWDKDLGLPSVIPCGLSIGLGGVGNYYFDIGGFLTFGKHKRTKEIFIRWAEMGTFSLIMRTHEGNKPRENWQFDSDDETLKILNFLVNVHIHLKPYLKFLQKEYQNKGIPPMRPLFLHYEGDDELFHIKYQYLLGSDLLIAPVIESNKKKWTVYLPEDDWIHLWSNKRFKGGNFEVKASIGEPPVFFREKSSFKELFLEIQTIKKDF